MADSWYVANAQIDLPRTSVGPAFSVIPQTAPKEFLSAVRADVTSSDDQPKGLRNQLNLCYRNSSLTMLLSSRRFLSYIRNWHLQEDLLVLDTAVHTSMLEDNILKALDDIARGMESRPLAGPNAQSDISNSTPRQRLDGAIFGFWEKFCDPEGRGMDPYVSDYDDNDTTADPVTDAQQDKWYKRRLLQEQQDANEFIMWIISVVFEQLDHYATRSVVTYQRERFESLLSVRQAERYVCSQCTFEVRRRTGGVSPSNCLNITFPESDWDKDFQQLKQAENLQDLLGRAFRESVEGLRCSRCQKVSTKDSMIEKYLTMRSTPEILLINISRNLTRWAQGNPGAFQQKKNLQAVEIPDVLDVTDWLEPNDFGAGSVVKYRLSGVVSHSGTTAGSGHYVSYVRDARHQDAWYEMNDRVVSPCTLEDFSDSQAADLDDGEFDVRFTPNVLLYELDPNLSRVLPTGRNLMNIGEGVHEDKRPTTYLRGTKRKRIEAVHDLPASGDENYQDAMIGEDSHDGAVMNMAIVIDDEVFKVPRTFIKQFNPDKSRLVDFKASLRAPVGRTNVKRRRLDLIKAYVDAEVERRERATRPRAKKKLGRPKGWKSRWTIE